MGEAGIMMALREWSMYIYDKPDYVSATSYQVLYDILTRHANETR